MYPSMLNPPPWHLNYKNLTYLVCMSCISIHDPHGLWNHVWVLIVINGEIPNLLFALLLVIDNLMYILEFVSIL